MYASRRSEPFSLILNCHSSQFSHLRSLCTHPRVTSQSLETSSDSLVSCWSTPYYSLLTFSIITLTTRRREVTHAPLWPVHVPTTALQAVIPADGRLLLPLERPSKYSALKWMNCSRTCGVVKNLRRQNPVRTFTMPLIASPTILFSS